MGEGVEQSDARWSRWRWKLPSWQHVQIVGPLIDDKI
jgi:hypothetical protein